MRRLFLILWITQAFVLASIAENAENIWQLTFISDRDGRPGIWLIDVNRTGLKKLYGGSYEACEGPSWSPDGRKLTFSRKLDSFWGENDLMLLERQIIKGEVFYLGPVELGKGQDPSWSPDGQWIAYVFCPSCMPGIEIPCGLWIMSADGSKRKLLLKGEPIRGPTWCQAFIPHNLSWSPNGEMIAFSYETYEFTGFGIIKVNFNFASPPLSPRNPTDELLIAGILGQCLGFTWTPKNEVCLLTYEGMYIIEPFLKPGLLYRMRALVEETPKGFIGAPDLLKLIQGAKGTFSSVACSPVDDRIAFVWNNRIYLTDNYGSFLTTLVNEDLGTLTDLIWSPDGEKLAFTSKTPNAKDIWVVNADGSGLSNLTKGEGKNWSPVWVPKLKEAP